MKKLFLLLFLLFFSFFGEVLASSAKSVVETQAEGDKVQVYQSVETTVNGETIKKESNQPGKLELEMKKVGENEPTVTFFQETISPAPATPIPIVKKPLAFSFVFQIIEFFRSLFLHLTT